MKNIILLLFVMTFFYSIGKTQDIPEKATTMVIAQSDSIGLKEKAIKALTGRGHTINSSKTAKELTTAANTLKNGARVSFKVKFEGSNIILLGFLPVAGQSTLTISYQGKKGTPTMNGWEEMEKIAKAIGGTVTYK